MFQESRIARFVPGVAQMWPPERAFAMCKVFGNSGVLQPIHKHTILNENRQYE
jgi:hypothetical protein